MIPGVTYLCDASGIDAVDVEGEAVETTTVRVCVDCGAESTLLDHNDRCPRCAEDDDADAEPADTYNDLADLDDPRGDGS